MQDRGPTGPPRHLPVDDGAPGGDCRRLGGARCAAAGRVGSQLLAYLEWGDGPGGTGAGEEGDAACRDPRRDGDRDTARIECVRLLLDKDAVQLSLKDGNR